MPGQRGGPSKRGAGKRLKRDGERERLTTTRYGAEKEDLEQQERGAAQREPEMAEIPTGYRTEGEECRNSGWGPDRETGRERRKQ